MLEAEALRRGGRNLTLYLGMSLSCPSFETILAAVNKQQWQLLSVHDFCLIRVRTGGCCFVAS
jgi:hypothetical protein